MKKLKFKKSYKLQATSLTAGLGFNRMSYERKKYV